MNCVKELVGMFFVGALKSVCVIFVIILALILIPIVLTYCVFDCIRTKIYRYKVYIDLDHDADLNWYKDIAIRDYGYYSYFVKADVEEIGDDEFYADSRIIVGATFYFLRSQNAVHFKLVHFQPD